MQAQRPIPRVPQELSLRRFVEQLKASAAAKALGERDNHGELPWAGLSPGTCEESPAAAEGPKPLLVAVIQRTRNRRIININALIKKLRSSFAAAAAAPPPRHGFSPESDLVRSAVIEQVCAHPYVCTDSRVGGLQFPLTPGLQPDT